jgi:hypothetical protein
MNFASNLQRAAILYKLAFTKSVKQQRKLVRALKSLLPYAPINSLAEMPRARQRRNRR